MISKLRAARLWAGRTLDEISTLAKIDRAKLSRAERGFVRLSPEEKIKIAAVLNCDPSDLWPDFSGSEVQRKEEADGN